MNQPTPDPSQEGNCRRASAVLFPSWEGSGVGSWLQMRVQSWRSKLFMNTGKCLWVVPVIQLTFAVTLPVQGDDRVTISKSRLEELERKEAELEKLKKEASKAEFERQQLESEQRRLKNEAVELKKAREAAEAKAAAAI